MRIYLKFIIILFLAACTTSADLTSQAERANTRKTLTALARTPTIELSNTATPSNTDSPTLTTFFTETPLPTFTPTESATWSISDTPSGNTASPTSSLEVTKTPDLNPSISPLPPDTDVFTSIPGGSATQSESATSTWTPSSTYTETASVTPSMLPTPTPENLPIEVHSELELRICTQIQGADCRIAGNISLTSPLLMQTANVSVTCNTSASLTNSASNTSAAIVISTGTIADCLIYRTMNTALSCCADTVSVNNAQDVVLRGNTILWGVDGTLDIANCDDCLVERNIIAESLNNSTHLQGAHSFLSLVRDSRRVRFVHNLLVSAKARLPQFQNCMDCAFLNNVIANYDGVGTLVTLCSEVDYANNFGLRGLDTDDIAYLIRTPNLADIPPGECRPQVFAVNNTVDWYRVFNPSDVKAGVYVLSPLTAYYPLEDVWTKEQIVAGAGNRHAQADRIRLCVMNSNCLIVDVPPS